MAGAGPGRAVNVETVNGVRILRVPAEGPAIGTEQDALDLIGETYGQEVDLIAVPAARLHPDFLRLRTRMAGDFMQKMQNYGLRLAIVGDISAAVAGSPALRDFVYESNSIGRMVFVQDEDEMIRRL